MIPELFSHKYKFSFSEGEIISVSVPAEKLNSLVKFIKEEDGYLFVELNGKLLQCPIDAVIANKTN